VVIWASAAFAGFESIRKLIEHGHTSHVGVGIVGAALGIAANQVVARYKLRARWTGRTLRVEIEGWVDPDLPAKEADAMGRPVASKLSHELPRAGSLTWTTPAAPA
jgi:divalent metal cation (Fe/Co/Zn/Cd) transporter